MNYITVEEAKALYRAKGLKPAAGQFRPINGACCIVGAMVEDHTNLSDTLISLELTVSYVIGFDRAMRKETAPMTAADDFLEGFKLGKALADWDGIS